MPPRELERRANTNSPCCATSRIQWQRVFGVVERQTVELEQEDELSGAFRIAPQVPQIAKNLGWVPGPASPNLIESLKRLTVDMLAHFANKLISAPNYLIKVVIDSPDGRNASSAIPVFDT